jgi:alkanesulfonate monooxygenase SsuD/methylene tetrahydromethanopterin reductase-like flavin-dependent oxidoreductase (luciferase family)
MMDFGPFHTWNALYAGGKVPWDPEYRGGKLLEEEAYARNFVEVEAVEAMGWDYLWLGGGHFSKQASMDPQVLMLAAVIAGRTRRIKIGSSVHRPVLKQAGETASARALPHEQYAFEHLQLEDPLQVAEQVALVDQVSQGRFIYGAGGRTRGSDARREHFFEFLEVMKQLWTEEHFSGFAGKYYPTPPSTNPTSPSRSPTRSPIRPCCCPWIARRASCPWATRAIASPSGPAALRTTSAAPRCSRRT